MAKAKTKKARVAEADAEELNEERDIRLACLRLADSVAGEPHPSAEAVVRRALVYAEFVFVGGLPEDTPAA